MHGVSVNEIAEVCEVSPAVLYQHFRSKEALYEQVINDLACERKDYVDAVLSGPSDFANVLYRMTVVFVKGRIRDADSVRIELRSLIDGDEIQKKFFLNHWKGLTDYIELTRHVRLTPNSAACAGDKRGSTTRAPRKPSKPGFFFFRDR
ncbi:MAG TPA: helix-turn-helix domain-containing protein [Thiobacillus sp.]